MTEIGEAAMGRNFGRAGFALLAILAGCGSGIQPAAHDAPAPKAQLARPASAASNAPLTVDEEVASFYKERGFKPLWVKGRTLSAEGALLLRLLEESDRDGLDPERYRVADIAAAIEAARSGEVASVARVELLLSSAFATYVRDLRAPVDEDDMFYVDKALDPGRPDRRDILDAAASAPSLRSHLAALRSMNPVYEALRSAAAPGDRRGRNADVLRANLDRMRALPADPGRRFVLVDTASARLWLFEDGRIVDTMRVIVGKRGQETPIMAGLIRHAVLNPYWNLPPDLARQRARRVLREGTDLLRRERLQVLSDWSDEARVVSPSSVDWKAVADGRIRLRMRQLPGGSNAMGAVKFMLPNRLGIYLHDTPDKASFGLEDRRLSSGCVRVEDAGRLARWLFKGKTLRPASAAPEQDVDLPEPVPVYITYLTAVPAKDRILFQRDPYRRDAPLLKRLSERDSSRDENRQA